MTRVEATSRTGHDPRRVVDVAFPVVGSQMPVDHGWSVYAAVSKVVPFVHGNPRVTIRGIEGCTATGDWLRLDCDARLELRALEDDLPRLGPLAGARLTIQGGVLELGEPGVRPLAPSPDLNARIVVVAGKLEWDDMALAIRYQLAAMDVEAEVIAGKRRVLTIKRFKNIGFGVGLSGLSPEGSMRVMTRGLGGRRSMGAGFFVPGPMPLRGRATFSEVGSSVQDPASRRDSRRRHR